MFLTCADSMCQALQHHLPSFLSSRMTVSGLLHAFLSCLWNDKSKGQTETLALRCIDGMIVLAFQIDRWSRCFLKWWLVWEPEGPKMLNASQRKKEPSSEGASNLSNAVLVYWPKLFKLWNPLNYIKLIDDLSKPTENSHGFEGSTFAFGVIRWFWGLGHWKHPDV